MVRVARTPKSVLEFKTLYRRRAVGASQLKPGALRTREIGFCKRSVPVAFCSVELRKVASAFERSPKSVLTRTFKNVKRAARTAKFMRMSRLFATCQEQSQVLLRQCEDHMASNSSEWRQLSEVVSNVLRNVRIAPVAVPSPVKAARKLQ